MKTSLARSLAILLSTFLASSCSSPSEPSGNENELPDDSNTEADSGGEPGPSGCNEADSPCPRGAYCDNGECRSCWRGFADRKAHGVTRFPRDIAVGDIDSDGLLDVVTAHSQNSSIDVTFGAIGGLGARRSYSLRYPARSLALADLNKDGRLDVLASTGGAINLLFGKGGDFGSPGNLSLDFNAGALKVADLDRNGILDFAVVDYDYWGIVALYASAGGNYNVEDRYRYLMDDRPSRLTIADIDRDGRLDFVATTADTNRVTVLLLRSRGAFEAGGSFATGARPWAVETVDINGDEWLDIVVANEASNNVSVLLSQPNGTQWNGFEDQRLYPVGNAPSAIAVGDVNGDGLPDLVVANENPGIPPGTVSVLLNRGGEGGAFDGFEQQLVFDVGSGPRALALGDFDGDGWLDVVTANHDSDNLSLLLSKVAPECASP